MPRPPVGERNSGKYKLNCLLRPQRKVIRLQDYDYSWPGAYFVTICSRDRRTVFGELIGQEFVPNALGDIVRDCWREIPTHFHHVVLDAFVLMPDHVHGILIFEQEDFRVPWSLRARHAAPLHGKAAGLAVVLRSFKSAATKRARTKLWQRGFYERIVRSEQELNLIRRYIEDNALV
jgi:REP element-mobilizing transposase RayT